MTAPTDAVNDIENENCHHMPTAKNALPAIVKLALRRFYG